MNLKILNLKPPEPRFNVHPPKPNLEPPEPSKKRPSLKPGSSQVYFQATGQNIFPISAVIFDGCDGVVKSSNASRKNNN